MSQTLYNATLYDETGGSGSDFPKTRWTLVLAAGKPSDPESRQALATLCEGYWYPVYAYIRRKSRDADAAKDLAQGFFTELLSGALLERANPEKGRFRAFVLTAVKFFLADERDRSNAQKRGGESLPFSLEDAEGRYIKEPFHNETPERIFERRWARAVLERVVNILRDDFIRHGRLDHFNHLKGYLMGQADVPYAQLAKRLDISESALKSGIHRFRKRYRDLLRAEVGSTVTDPAEIDSELRFLLTALSARD